MGLDEKAPPMNKPREFWISEIILGEIDTKTRFRARLSSHPIPNKDNIHVIEHSAYAALKKENEELIYKNWALKNAYDNVDDKNTQLKSLCQRLENVLENVKSKIEYHSQAYALDIMSDDGRKPCTTTAGRMGRHMCKVFSEYLSEALKGEES